MRQLGDSVIEFLTNVYDIDAQTFKVNTRRANKQYPIESMEVNAILGETDSGCIPEYEGGCASSGDSDSRGAA